MMKRIYSISCSLTTSDAIDFRWQPKKGKYLATTSFDNTVNIYSRHGEPVEQINLFGSCLAIAWDGEGDLLAIVTDKSTAILLWNSVTRAVVHVDTGLKETFTLLCWSKMMRSTLMVGGVRGSILIYNHQTARKLPLIGKHSKKIVSGAWSDSNLIALVSDDRTLSISEAEGETITVKHLKGEGSDVQFVHSYFDEKVNSSEHNTVAVVVNKKVLLMILLADLDRNVVCSFQEWYGSILSYYPYANGNLFIAFYTGLVVTISTCHKNFGAELFQIKAHREVISCMTVCTTIAKIATCSDNSLKVFDMFDHGDIETVMTIDDEPSIQAVQWSDDGQLLALASTSGTIHCYLSQLKILGDSFGTSLAFLSSLLEVTIFNVHEEVQDSVLIVRIEIEPSKIAIGPFHLAVAMNNKIWFYSLTGADEDLLGSTLIGEREYVGIVKEVKLNGTHVAVQFTNGALQFQTIEPGGESNRVFVYPDGDISGRRAEVTSLCLTNEFLVFSLGDGSIVYFVIEDWQSVTIFRHRAGLKKVIVHLNGTRLILLDERNDVFVYNVYGETLVSMPAEHVPSKINSCLWESWLADRSVFTLDDGKFMHVYASARDTINGPQVEWVGKMKIPVGQYPLLLYNGVVVCQTKSGKTSNFVLTTHDYSIKASEGVQREVFKNIVRLRRFADALKIANYVNDESMWSELAHAALVDFELDTALAAYRHLEQYGQVYLINSFAEEEERNLLAGYIAEMLQRFELAQRHFLSSSKPLMALEMRKNLLQWDEALALARRLAPNEVASLTRQLAEQLDHEGHHREALENFEQALDAAEAEPQVFADDEARAAHLEQCRAGVARNALRCNDLRKGLSIGLELANVPLLLELASILEGLRHTAEAAQLYERAGDLNRAAQLYLQVHNTNKLNSLLGQVTDETVLADYARHKEAERQFRSAAEIYQRAGRWLDVVRIQLDHLNNPSEAVRIVREHRSIEGAKLVAKFFQRLNDTSTAIEFLVMSRCFEDAYAIAKTTGQMDTYADIMADYGRHNRDKDGAGGNNMLADFRSIGIYYEEERKPLQAGRFYCLARQYKKGLRLLLQAAGESSESEAEAINLSIEAAAEAKDEQVTRTLLDFLVGETDGMPKEFKYLFKLYMRLGQYREAAKTAVVIAREEQNLGNYRNAHQLLFGMSNELRRNEIVVPMEMNVALMLVHSYIIAKIWIRVGDHLNAARLLMRVAENLDKFPSHTMQILTSLVIECQRAGLPKNTLKYAHILMRPENRDKVDAKFKRKIETLVRKSPGGQVPDDEAAAELAAEHTPCPYCAAKVEEYDTACGVCRRTLPFCMASGHHLVPRGLARCPGCRFPAIEVHLLKLLAVEPSCPLCAQPLAPDKIEPIAKFEDIDDQQH